MRLANSIRCGHTFVILLLLVLIQQAHGQNFTEYEPEWGEGAERIFADFKIPLLTPGLKTNPNKPRLTRIDELPHYFKSLQENQSALNINVMSSGYELIFPRLRVGDQTPEVGLSLLVPLDQASATLDAALTIAWQLQQGDLRRFRSYLAVQMVFYHSPKLSKVDAVSALNDAGLDSFAIKAINQFSPNWVLNLAEYRGHRQFDKSQSMIADIMIEAPSNGLVARSLREYTDAQVPKIRARGSISSLRIKPFAIRDPQGGNHFIDSNQSVAALSNFLALGNRAVFTIHGRGLGLHAQHLKRRVFAFYRSVYGAMSVISEDPVSVLAATQRINPILISEDLLVNQGRLPRFAQLASIDVWDRQDDQEKTVAVQLLQVKPQAVQPSALPWEAYIVDKSSTQLLQALESLGLLDTTLSKPRHYEAAKLSQAFTQPFSQQQFQAGDRLFPLAQNHGAYLLLLEAGMLDFLFSEKAVYRVKLKGL